MRQHNCREGLSPERWPRSIAILTISPTTSLGGKKKSRRKRNVRRAEMLRPAVDWQTASVSVRVSVTQCVSAKGECRTTSQPSQSREKTIQGKAIRH